MEQINKPTPTKVKAPVKEEKKSLPTYRHLIQVELISVKRYFENEKENKKDDLKEYYFEVGDRSNRSRIPTKGYFTLGMNTEDENPVSITLYSRFYDGEENEILEIPIWIKEKNDQLMKFDDTISFKKIQFKLGAKDDLFTMKEAGTELKISLVSRKTKM